jgi:hypothetical protein
MRSFLGASASVLFATGAAGCYFIDPYSDLVGGGGASDASATDTGATMDAGGDAGFCAKLSPPATFCDDFDDGRPLSTSWSQVTQWEGGALGIDTDAGILPPSPPATLQASAQPADTGPGGPREYVTQTFGVTASLHVEFDARADDLGSSTTQATLLTIITQDNAANAARTLLYYVTAADAEMEEEESIPNMPDQTWPLGLPAPPPLGQWVHYTIDLLLTAGANARMTVKLDGSSVLSEVVLGQAWAAGNYDVSFGLWWINGMSAGPYGFHYDNVVVDVQ